MRVFVAKFIIIGDILSHFSMPLIQFNMKYSVTAALLFIEIDDQFESFVSGG